MSKTEVALKVQRPKTLLSTKKVVDEALTLGREAQQVLGYSWLAERAERVNAESELIAALVKLEIDILTAESVSKYMAAKTALGKDAVQALQVKIRRYEARVRRGEVNDYPNALKKRKKEFAQEAAKLSVLSWREEPIDSYKNPIPEEILHKAIRLKRALPKVKISVVHTIEETPKLKFDNSLWRGNLPQREPAGYPDPFLKATLGNSSAYIGVWDEKDYPYAALQDLSLAD